MSPPTVDDLEALLGRTLDPDERAAGVLAVRLAAGIVADACDGYLSAETWPETCRAVALTLAARALANPTQLGDEAIGGYRVEHAEPEWSTSRAMNGAKSDAPPGCRAGSWPRPRRPGGRA